MPLVSMKEMLNVAKDEKYAVGQFNVNNLEYAQAILQAAEEEKSPVILGVSEGAGRYMGGFQSCRCDGKSIDGRVRNDCAGCNSFRPRFEF